MSYKTIKSTQEIEAVDIPTMADMPIEEYKDYLRFGLIFVDHHDILRSAVAGYPLAVNKEQLNALIAYLNEIAPKIGS